MNNISAETGQAKSRRISQSPRIFLLTQPVFNYFIFSSSLFTIFAVSGNDSWIFDIIVTTIDIVLNWIETYLLFSVELVDTGVNRHCEHLVNRWSLEKIVNFESPCSASITLKCEVFQHFSNYDCNFNPHSLLATSTYGLLSQERSSN